MVKRKTALAIASALFVMQIAGAWIVFKSRHTEETVSSRMLRPETTARIKSQARFSSAASLRLTAEKMQYYPHKPDDVTALLRKAIRKAPADYENFFSYAHHLLSRNCCKQDVLKLLDETLRRCPTNPKMHRIAAAYYVSMKEKHRAFPYFRKAIELEPAIAKELYRTLDEHHANAATLIEVTPSTSPQALLQLSYFLGGKEEVPAEFESVLKKTASARLLPQERLQLAQLARQKGFYSFAHENALLAAKDSKVTAEAYLLLAEIAWEKHDLHGFEKYSAEAEKAFASDGNPERAAETVIDASRRYFNSGDPLKAKEKLLNATKVYPRFPPLFFELAAQSKNESSELPAFYMKKAATLAPDDPKYQRAIANYYLEQKQYEDAAAILEKMMMNPETRTAAYSGIARMRRAQGLYADAIAILLKGIEDVGKQGELLLELGKLYEHVGDYAVAAEMYEEYARQIKNSADPYLMAADACLKGGDYAKARDLYQEALDKDPSSSHARESLNRLAENGF